MCTEIGKMTNKLEIIASQIRFIKSQEEDGIPVGFTKVRCPCLKTVKWLYAYRCLYCGVFYCRKCAEQHFGKTILEYRQEAVEI